jgi:hypothetical protein
MLLALLALALPMATLADIKFLPTGDFVSGSAKSTSDGGLNVEIIGSENIMSFETGPLIAFDCVPEFTCFEFTGNNVNTNSVTRCAPLANSAPACTGKLTGDLMGGVVDIQTLNNSEAFSADAVLKPPIMWLPNGVPMPISFLSGNLSGSWTLSASGMVEGDLTVTATNVPEPVTFGMLGTGLVVGLARIARRKLKLGR